MGCNCQKKEEEYSIPDIETGFRVKVSKEQYEAYLRMWKSVKPMLTDKYKGKVILVGTAGELNEGYDYSLFFKQLKDE